MHLAQQLVQRISGLLVEIAGRLVGQQHRRTHDERPGHRDALLLATRQHARAVRQPVAQPDTLEQFSGAPPGFGERGSRNAHGHCRVFERVEFRKQVVELKDEPDVAVAERDDLGIGQGGQFGVGDGDGALVCAIEASQEVQEGALAHARGADDGHHFARCDRQMQITQHGQRRAANRVGLHEAARFEKRHDSSDAAAKARKHSTAKTRLSCFCAFVADHSYLRACTGSSLAAWREG